MDKGQLSSNLTVELTILEAMALGSGVHFYEQPQITINARRKVLSQLENRLFPEINNKIGYELIEA